jgi:putative oxidoreductase
MDATMAAAHSVFASLGLLILRLGVGGLLAVHGWSKLQMVLGGQLDKFADPIGLGSAASLILVTVAEFGCAILVMLGLATRLAAIPPVVAMAVAAFIVHAKDPWSLEQAARQVVNGMFMSGPAKEGALLYLIPFLTLVFTGAGRISFDALIWGRRPKGAEAAAQARSASG